MITLGIPPDSEEEMLVHEDLWWKARDWAEQYARELGDVDPDYDEEMIDDWQEKHYIWLCGQEGREPFVYRPKCENRKN